MNAIREAGRDAERKYVTELLRTTGSISAAARLLGMERVNLKSKMRRLGLRLRDVAP